MFTQLEGIDPGNHPDLPVPAAIDKLCADSTNSLYTVAEKIGATAKFLEIADEFKVISCEGNKLAGDMYCYRGFSSIVSNIEDPTASHSFKLAAINAAEPYIRRIKEFGNLAVKLSERLADTILAAAAYAKECSKVPYFLTTFSEALRIVPLLDTLKRVNVHLGNNVFTYKSETGIRRVLHNTLRPAKCCFGREISFTEVESSWMPLRIYKILKSKSIQFRFERFIQIVSPDDKTKDTLLQDELIAFISSSEYVLLRVSKALKNTVGVSLVLSVALEYCLSIVSGPQLFIENHKHICVCAFIACAQIYNNLFPDSQVLKKYSKDQRLRLVLARYPVAPIYADVLLDLGSAFSRVPDFMAAYKVMRGIRIEFEFNVVRDIDKAITEFEKVHAEWEHLARPILINFSDNPDLILKNDSRVVYNCFQKYTKLMSLLSVQLMQTIFQKFYRPANLQDKTNLTTEILSYELALRYNLKPREKYAIMKYIKMIKTLSNTIMSNWFTIKTALGSHTANTLHSFIDSTVTPLLMNVEFECVTDSDRELYKFINSMRITDKFSTSAPRRAATQVLRAARHIESESQLTKISASEFKFAVVAFQLFPPKLSPDHHIYKNIKDFTLFGDTSPEIYLDKNTIKKIANLGYLWLRETYVGIDKCKKYSIDASLPWILIKFMLSQINAECSADIILPLEIYNDCAENSLEEMKSQYLYDEIREESIEALDILSSFLSCFLYKYAVAWCTGSMFQNIGDEPLYPPSRPYRSLNFFLPLLSTRPFTFLGRTTSISELLGNGVSREINRSISSVISLIERGGLHHIRTFSRALEITKDVHSMLLDHLPLAPYSDIFDSVDITPKASNNRIRATIANKILLCASEISYDTCSGAGRLLSSVGGITDNNIEKEVLNLREFGSFPLIFKTLHESNPGFITYEHYDSMVQICGLATICNVVADIGDIIAEDICSFVEKYLGHIIRTCPKIPKLPLAHYGSIASYHYYMANLQNLGANIDIKNTVIPLVRRLGNIIVAVKHIDESIERSKLSRMFQENCISDHKNLLHNILVNVFDEIKYDRGINNEILSSLQRIKFSRENISVLTGFLKYIDKHVYKTVLDILDGGKKDPQVTISAVWSIIQFLICSELSMNNKSVIYELGECISWLGCTIVGMSRETETYRNSEILKHILNIHSLDNDTAHKTIQKRSSEPHSSSSTLMIASAVSNHNFKCFLFNAEYICRVNDRVMDVVINSLA